MPGFVSFTAIRNISHHRPPLSLCAYVWYPCRSGYIQQRLESRSSHLGSILTHPQLSGWLTSIDEQAREKQLLTLHAYGGGPGFEVLLVTHRQP